MLLKYPLPSVVIVRLDFTCKKCSSGFCGNKQWWAVFDINRIMSTFFLKKYRKIVNLFVDLQTIVKRERFDPQALRTVTELRRKARSQDRFTL